MRLVACALRRPANLVVMMMADTFAVQVLGVIGLLGSAFQMYTSYQIKSHGMALI